MIEGWDVVDLYDEIPPVYKHREACTNNYGLLENMHWAGTVSYACHADVLEPLTRHQRKRAALPLPEEEDCGDSYPRDNRGYDVWRVPRVFGTRPGKPKLEVR